MEVIRNLKFVPSVLFILAFLYAPVFVFAYEPDTTHRGLTRDTIRFFEANYPELEFESDEERLLIEKGTVNEDHSTRPLRHFYDPVYDRGISLLSKEYPTSKIWVKDTEMQANYGDKIGFNDKFFSSETDYSWDRAVYEYAHGDKKRALETLGHVLHLIQDLTVPDHTRNDKHPPYMNSLVGQQSPYEKWTSRFNADNILISEKLIAEGKRTIPYDSIDKYFVEMSKFSNSNFFSKDTVFDDEYGEPKVKFEKKEKDSNNKTITFGYNNIGLKEYKLVVVKNKYIKKENKYRKDYIFNNDDNTVISDYWEILSEQAVLNGAGVIRLFFDAVERERKTLALEEKNKSRADRVLAKLRPAGFDLAKGLYGSSLTNEDVEELLGDSQAGAVVLAVDNEPKTDEDIVAVDNVNVRADEPQTQAVEPEVVEVLPPSVSSDEGGETDDGDTGGEGDGERAEGARQEDVDKEPGLGDFLFPIPPGAGGGGGGGASVPAPQAPATDTTAPNAPTVTTPSDFSQTFTATSILFAGTAEATSTISTDFSSATTTTDSAGNWSILLSSFPQGTTTLQFFATDSAGNTSTATSITFFVDSIAPDIFLTVSECEDSLSTSDCIVATTALNISWSSSASDFDYFIINNNSVVSTTIATSTTTTASDNTTFSFSVSARDNAGNYSATTTTTARVATSPVVINEIAWMGTSVSNSSDEWIELYNNTNADIPLSGWTLYAEDETPYIPLSGTIPANGYYLIERKDDNSVSDIAASLIYGNDGSSWALNNSSGEHLILARTVGGATTTVDEILKCHNWCGKGTTYRYKTMERYDPLASGADWSNWGTNLNTIRNGKDAEGNVISGTPKQRNYMSYLLNKNTNITSDLTLTKNKSPYLVDNTSITLQADKTLTIEPGVVIKFRSSAWFSADGNIVANGTSGDKIVFTSFYDDDYGGDTNGDGICDPGNASSTAVCPYAGSWFGIELSGVSVGSSFDHTIFRYGGGSAISANLYIDNISPPISNSVFEYSKQYGLYIVNASSTIANNIFRNNAESNSSAGLFGNGGAPVITNNTFSYNKTGLNFTASNAAIISNTFTNNSYRAADYHGRLGGYFSLNDGSGNKINGISLHEMITAEYATTTLKKNNLPYVFDVYNTTVTASSTLVIEPGVVLKMQNYPLFVRGHLKVAGEDGNIVLFTSMYDDSDGNDAGNDGASTGIVGNQVVEFYNGATSDINYAEFRYMKIGTAYTNSPIDLENVTYSNNDLGVFAGAGETILKAENIIFIDNIATSTIPLIP